MTQEEKQLLLQDLCARLPYGVITKNCKKNSDVPAHLLPHVNGIKLLIAEYDLKPYLRPMSSMTEEEKKEFKAFHCVSEWHPEFYQAMCNLPNINNMINWLDKKMFDHRGLIPKGLALEATEGMYKNI